MYDPVNSPVRDVLQLGLAHNVGTLATTLWMLETADDHIAVEAAGYISDGGNRGMKVGDPVLVRNTTNGAVTLHTVTAVGVGTDPYQTPTTATLSGAGSIENTVATGLVAAGNSQGTALALAADINQFATVGAGTGAILRAMQPGDSCTVFNGGANALALYPPVGASINKLAANTAYNIATATPTCYVTCVSPTQYLASQAA